MNCLKIVVGLGNPGLKYRFTRHNIGFMVIDNFAEDLRTEFKKVKSYDSFIAREMFKNQKVIILKPQTYMNLSGIAVKKLISYYKVPLQDLLIVYDDLNLELGQIRIRERGSSGGHNGMESIIQCLKSKDIPRLRIGIGGQSLNPELDYVPHVLSCFNEKEKDKLKRIISLSKDAVKSVITDGFEKAMREYNKKQYL